MAEKNDRDVQALELRRAGVPVPKIREQLGYRSQAAVEAGLKRAMDAAGLVVDPTSIRAIELDRYDRLQQAIWVKAVRGDVQALDRVLRLSELRMKLAGIPDDKMVMRQAFDKTVQALGLDDIDGAAIAAGRRIAEQIDSATATGDGLQVTKALYLIPHLMNVLDKLGATPAARNELTEVADRVTSAPAEDDLLEYKRRNGIA